MESVAIELRKVACGGGCISGGDAGVSLPTCVGLRADPVCGSGAGGVPVGGNGVGAGVGNCRVGDVGDGVDDPAEG